MTGPGRRSMRMGGPTVAPAPAAAPIRIRIDRLVLDGLAPGTAPADIERALRRALASSLAGLRPAGSRTLAQVGAGVTSTRGRVSPAAAAEAAARVLAAGLSPARPGAMAGNGGAPEAGGGAPPPKRQSGGMR